MGYVTIKKYRIASVRLQSWDYASEAMYFITICTKDRENYFGEIINAGDSEQRCAALKPTEIGKIAHDEWHKTPETRPDMNIELGEFIVMPNHIHGIIIIGANEYNTQDTNAIHRVSPSGSNIKNNTRKKNQFAPQSKNLASIIRGYKSAVTTFARKNNIKFDWQSSFYEHIIRTPAAFQRISNYIINNPEKWLKNKSQPK